MRNNTIKTTMITASRIKMIVVKSRDSWMMPSGSTIAKRQTNEVKFEIYLFS